MPGEENHSLSLPAQISGITGGGMMDDASALNLQPPLSFVPLQTSRSPSMTGAVGEC